MHPALTKGPLFYKTPPIFHFFTKTPPPFRFLPTGLQMPPRTHAKLYPQNGEHIVTTELWRQFTLCIVITSENGERTTYPSRLSAFTSSCRCWYSDRSSLERDANDGISAATRTNMGQSDVTESVTTIRSPFCGYNTAKCVELIGEDLSCYSIKNEYNIITSNTSK